MNLNLWDQLALFAGQTSLVVVGAVIIILVAASFILRAKVADSFKIENLNRKFADMSRLLRTQVLNKKEFKKWSKQRKASIKDARDEKKRRVFVLEFEGDLRATRVENLRKEISMVLTTAEKEDEVVVVVESTGGTVHTYGLAASQLNRVREHGIKLTVCVDKVAASGGYLMACVADQILSAPFAILGSIGVVAQVPNFNRFLN